MLKIKLGENLEKLQKEKEKLPKNSIKFEKDNAAGGNFRQMNVSKNTKKNRKAKKDIEKVRSDMEKLVELFIKESEDGF